MPPPSRAPARIALLCALLSTGCAPAPPAALVVPPSLLTCAPEPTAPEAPDDPALARWILDLAEAGADCRSRLNAIRMVVTP